MACVDHCIHSASLSDPDVQMSTVGAADLVAVELWVGTVALELSHGVGDASEGHRGPAGNATRVDLDASG